RAARSAGRRRYRLGMARRGTSRAGERAWLTDRSGQVERDAIADARAGAPRWSLTRLLFLGVTGVCLYFLLPSIAEVLAAWDRLGALAPGGICVILVCGAASLGCQWELQAITLGTRDWFSLITTHLAANSFNKITPGGGATGTAFQASLLADAGLPLTA